MSGYVCHHCGYDLTGLSAEGICPECGHSYDVNRRYHATDTRPHPIVAQWKAILLALTSVMIILCGGGLSLISSNPLGMAICTMLFGLMPAVGAVVYWIAEQREQRELDEVYAKAEKQKAEREGR